MVYKHFFRNSGVSVWCQELQGTGKAHVTSNLSLQLLAVCSIIHNEASAIMFGETVFTLNSRTFWTVSEDYFRYDLLANLDLLRSQIGEKSLARVQKLEVSAPASRYHLHPEEPDEYLELASLPALRSFTVNFLPITDDRSKDGCEWAADEVVRLAQPEAAFILPKPAVRGCTGDMPITSPDVAFLYRWTVLSGQPDSVVRNVLCHTKGLANNSYSKGYEYLIDLGRLTILQKREIVISQEELWSRPDQTAMFGGSRKIGPAIAGE